MSRWGCLSCCKSLLWWPQASYLESGRLLGRLEGAEPHAHLMVFDPLYILLRVVSDAVVVLTYPSWVSLRKKYRSWALDIQNWLRQQWASPKALTLCRFCRISKSLPTNKCQDRFPEAPVPPLGLCHGTHAPSRWNQPLGLCWIWHLSKWLLESMGGLAGLPGCCLRANNHGGSSQGQENGSWKQTGDGRRLSKNKSDTSLLYGAFFYSVSVTLDSYYNFQIFYSKFSNLLVFDIDSLVKSIYI